MTGAAGGMGADMVRALRAAGVRVVAADRDPGVVDAFASDDGVLAVTGDITSAADRADLVSRALSLGPIDYLVTARGTLKLLNIPDVTEELWDRIQAVNATSVFFMCQAVAPHIRPKGAIVNYASVAGKLAGTVENAPYSASKAAVIAITKTFAYYLAPRVRVNCVCPGSIDTPMLEQFFRDLAEATRGRFDDLWESRAAAIPLERAGTPADVTRVVMFLLSSDAQYMTGQAINVTGGTMTF